MNGRRRRRARPPVMRTADGRSRTGRHWQVIGMGLSRYEQRVLQEIERWFHRTDPDFAIAMSA
ncbi:hypothetical protein C1I98_15980, partial [Spongiactinospora gelatinilytica]